MFCLTSVLCFLSNKVWGQYEFFFLTSSLLFLPIESSSFLFLSFLVVTPFIKEAKDPLVPSPSSRAFVFLHVVVSLWGQVMPMLLSVGTNMTQPCKIPCSFLHAHHLHSFIWVAMQLIQFFDVSFKKNSPLHLGSVGQKERCFHATAGCVAAAWTSNAEFWIQSCQEDAVEKWP